MSKECGFVVNGQRSPLYDKILKAYNGNEELAIILHSRFKNDTEILRQFGNWIEDYGVRPEYYDYKPGESRIEDNGEPKLFKNEKNGNYYYIDKDKNKVEVIENTVSLKSLFNNQEINRINDVLVANFTKNELGLDFENIDLNKEASTIRKSVVKKLNERISVFNKSNNKNFQYIAELLEIALDENLDELVKNVVTALEVMKIKSSENFNDNDEDSDLAEIEDNENQKDPTFDKASYESSTKGNITANAKIRMSLIPDTNAKDNFLNDTVYLTFDEVYASLLPYLTSQVAIEKDGSIEDNFELMKSIILEISHKKTYFEDLYNILSKPDLSEEIKNEFTQAFNLDMNNFNTSEYSYKESENEADWIYLEDGRIIKPKIKTYKNMNISETGKKESEVFTQWNKNFKEYFVTETKDSSSINAEDKKKLAVIKADLNKIKYSQKDNIDEILKVLRSLGIESTPEGFQHFIDDLKLVNNDNELSEKIFNKFIEDLNRLVDRINNNTNTKYDDILSDQQIIKKLAKAEAFYISEGSDSSVFTGGKQKWIYSYPSYLSNTIKSWKKDRNILLKHYQISKFNEGSDWMEYLLALGDTYQVDEYEDEKTQEELRVKESRDRISKLSIYTFNTSQEEGKSIDGKTGKDISKAEYISDTMNKILGFKVGRKAYYRTTTAADKSTQLEIAINRYLETNARYDDNGDIILNGEIYDVIYKYFDSEYKRMGFEREFMRDPNNADKLRVYYHTDNKGRIGMHFNPKDSKRTYFTNLAEYEAYPVEGTKQLLGNAFKSQLFPLLSPSEIKATLKNSNLKFENIYDANGYAYLSTSDNAGFKQLIQEYIKNELSENIKKTQDNLISNNVFEKVGDVIVNKELDTKIWNSYQSDNALKASADFFINSLMSHVEYSKMFSGDVAYYKNEVDYKKRVPSTYTDGLYQRLNNDNKTYNVAVTESINIAEPFLPELIELLGEDLANKYGYDEDGKPLVNAADAQAWITPVRWRDLMKTIGKWNSTYESAYNKLTGDNTEPFTAEELKAVAPPLKGVYFQIVNGVPTFLKYSQAVLSPRLRKGNGLEKIYDKMVNNKDSNGNDFPIDELVTFDAIKVGSNQPIKIHDDNGLVLNDFQLQGFTIPSNGWKLQQDLPVKLMHDTEVGSQIQKNIFQGLAFNLDKMFDLDTPTKTTIIVSNEQSEAIDNVWNENAELKEIFKNNKNLYQEYLNSIFPDSKVKDIVYHGGTVQDIFTKENIGKSTINSNKNDFGQPNAFYFSTSKESSKTYGNVKQIILNVKNPAILEQSLEDIGFGPKRKNKFDSVKNLNLKEKDSFILKDIFDAKYLETLSTKDLIEDVDRAKQNELNKKIESQHGDTIGIFDPEQIHILGSKQDIEQAKEFVNNQSKSSEVSGNQIIENIANVTGALSNLGLESIYKEFGIDNNGKITNIDGFYQSIIAELKSTKGSQNVIDSLESEMAIYGVVQAQDKLQNIFSSILTKRLLKIKTNGGSFIQMSNFGLNNEQANKQNVIWNPRALKTTHPPQFLKDENGEFILSENGKKIIRPGGILLSGSFIAKYIPDYKKYKPEELFGYTNENGEFVEGVIDRKILENIIGYRIPNQGLSSNDALEIVGILPEETGDTVVAYTGITTKTGSDFDIDKMYLMFPTIKPYIKGLSKLLKDSGLTNKVAFGLLEKEGFKGISFDRANETLFEYLENKIQNEEVIPENLQEFVKTINSILDQKIVSKLKYVNYDNSKPESEQTKGSLQNRLIELYKSVLLNENVIGEVMTPVDFTHVKDDILHFVNKPPITNLSTFNQLDDIDTKYDFLAGKAGVGQQANALMDYVLGSLGNLSITNFNVPKSNNRLDMEYSQKLSQEDLDYYAKELGLDKDQVKKLQSVKIGHSLSAILNAFVDIAKDPYITRGNWVTMTTNTGNLLLRKGVHPFYVNAFLAQPILKEYIEFSASYEASENQGLSTADAFIKERFGEDKYNKRNNSNIFNEDLKTLRSKEFLNKESSQMNVFATFLKYQSASKAIKDNINASKHMVDGIGGSVNSLMIAKNAVDSILEAEDRYNQLEDKSEFKDNIILGFRSKFTNPNGSESIFSKYYNNVILEPVKIVRANPILFLEGNQTIQNTFNEISHDLKNQILVDFEKGSGNLGKILNKTFYSYVMSGFNSLSIKNQERKDLALKFPKEFEQFQKDNKDKYAIIDQMKVAPGNTLDFIGLNNRKKSQDFEKLMVGSFLDLINTNEEFANKLIKYSYLTSGFNNHSSQFFTMIPTQWFNRNNINRYIIDTNDKYKANSDVNDDFFIDQFYLANLENKKYVKRISEKQILEGSLNIQGFVVDKPGKVGYYRFKEDPNGINPTTYYKLIGYNVDNQGVYGRFIPNINDELSEIKPLNVKDKKGNRIINYDTNGINLKPVTETAPSLAKNINKKTLSNLHDSAIYNRDRFYRENVIIKKESEIENKIEIEVINENKLIDNIQESKVMNNLKEMFQQGLMLDKFSESGINSIEDLDNKSEDELGELLKKICK